VFPKALSNAVVADGGVLRTPEGDEMGKALETAPMRTTAWADGFTPSLHIAVGPHPLPRGGAFATVRA
jgi:hypothetical protein